MIRIVQLHIKKEAIDTFQKVFNNHQNQITAFEGCHKLELWQVAGHKQRFITYSIWEDESALSNYRNSDLFTHVWSMVKPLLESKAEAWSQEKL